MVVVVVEGVIGSVKGILVVVETVVGRRVVKLVVGGSSLVKFDLVC